MAKSGSRANADRSEMRGPPDVVSLHPGYKLASLKRSADAVRHSERDFRGRDLCRRLRELARLRRAYGRGRWRKRKGVALVRLADDSVHLAELHWYEASGIGRKEFKIKRLL